MAFLLNRPASPEMHIDPSTYSHSAPSSSAATPAPPPMLPLDTESATGKEKGPRLEILLDKECVFLRGTGVDVEPARLSGHVALHLTESTSVKEITLQFRGKARLPVPAHDSLSLNPSPLTYIVCHHDWSFLEGEKKHSHTLKAGRHLFPFQLQLGGSLPSSAYSNVCGGASVFYKLRAHASRPGLSSNLQAIVPLTVVRSFAPEALEYQQTLEIENTWPDKLMYSIMIPHKAWAAGDTLTAVTKFSPLAKGVAVLSIQTTVHETTKIYGRVGYQEHTRPVVSTRHEIANGKAVEVDLNRRHTTPGSPTRSPGGQSSAPTTPAARMSSMGSYFAMPPPPPSPGEAGPSSAPSSSGPSEEEDIQGDTDVVTHITVPIPNTITPTHALDPIIVSHRIRWSILILNLDGHTSELRCSLPLHLLDYHVLEEARSYTSATRRLLIGGPDVPPSQEEDDMELPSYTAHVRDRVANMFLPQSATMRVTNPWVQGGVSPTVVGVGDEGYAGSGAATGYGYGSQSPWPRSHSGASTPLEAHLLSHLPHQPGSGDSTPLDWVNSELLLSLSHEQPPTLSQASLSAATAAATAAARQSQARDRHGRSASSSSPSDSDPSSARPSRHPSRAGSPERGVGGGRHHANGHANNNNETYVHSGNQASRNLGSVFKASMKPFTSITHPGWLSRSSSHNNIPALAMTAQSQQSQAAVLQQQQQQQAQQAQGPRLQFADPNSGTALLHRAFTEVPDYLIASRGFIGGVPPLESMRGLPSYEEAEQRQRRTESSANTSANASASASPNMSRASPLPPPSPRGLGPRPSLSLPVSPRIG